MQPTASRSLRIIVIVFWIFRKFWIMIRPPAFISCRNWRSKKVGAESAPYSVRIKRK